MNTPPDPALPRVWCDFNACGWSDEDGDDCFYSLHREQLAALPPEAGRQILIWDHSDEVSVIAVVAILEPFRLHPVASGWRARPLRETWYEGPKDDQMLM
jgi:hypothetical protein